MLIFTRVKFGKYLEIFKTYIDRCCCYKIEIAGSHVNKYELKVN